MTKQIEVVEDAKPGTLSTSLTGQLKQVGAKLKDKDLVEALDRVESVRRDFSTEAMVTGLMLLAKRETFPASNGKKKGSWKEYVETRIATSGSSCQRLPCETYRTVRHYVSLARRLLWQIETRTWERPNNAAYFTPDQIATLKATDPGTLLAQPESARAQIAAIVSHRSLRQLLADFRKAEQLMDDEDAAQPQPPAPPKDPQEDFYHILMDDIENVRSRRRDPYFFRQEKSVVLQWAEKLKEEAEEIIRMVNGEAS